jgi:hypothetical protein
MLFLKLFAFFKKKKEAKPPLSGVISQLWLLTTGGYRSPEGSQLCANPLT